MHQEAAEQIVGKKLMDWEWEDRKALAELLSTTDLDDEFTFDFCFHFHGWCTEEVITEWRKRFAYIRDHSVGYVRFTRFSHFSMPALEIYNPTPTQHNFIRTLMSSQRMDCPHYKARRGSGAFLQSDSESYVLIEFWEPRYQGFVDYFKSNWPEGKDDARATNQEG